MTEGLQTKIIGVAGETACGKSTFCTWLVDRVPRGQVRVLSLDSSYRSQEHLPVFEREQVNFDHPDAFDRELLIDHVDKLRQGQDIRTPVYGFHFHLRLEKTIEVSSAPVIVVGGILALHWEDLRRRYDYRIFVDASEKLRLNRRIARDTTHRGRTRQSVIDQWQSSVQVMSAEYCVPTKRYADLIVDGKATADNQVDKVLDLLDSSECDLL